MEKALRKALGDNVEIVGIEIDPKSSASHIMDVLLWKYRDYPPGYFNFIWASPPCKEFSMAHSVGERNLVLGDALAKRTIEIIEYFSPDVWFLENPHNGRFALRKRPYMAKWAKYLNKTHYCMYGTPFKKTESIYCNQPLELLECNHTKHDVYAQSGRSKDGTPGVGNTKKVLYPIPEPLLRALFRQCGVCRPGNCAL